MSLDSSIFTLDGCTEYEGQTYIKYDNISLLGKRNRWFTDVIYNCSKCRGLPQLREIHCRDTRLFISESNTVVMYFFKRCSATKDKEINRTFPKKSGFWWGVPFISCFVDQPITTNQIVVVYICGICPPFGTLLKLNIRFL